MGTSQSAVARIEARGFDVRLSTIERYAAAVGRVVRWSLGQPAHGQHHVAQLLRTLKEAGLALVVVEHLMGFLELVADFVVVLNAGSPIFHGSLRDAIRDPQVVEVFLGEHP